MFRVWNGRDFDRLKTIGVLAQGQLGQRVESNSQGEPTGTADVARKHAGFARDGSGIVDKLWKCRSQSLTEEGKLIVDLLDRPTSLGGMCKSAARLAQFRAWASAFARNSSLARAPRANSRFSGDVTSLCPRELTGKCGYPLCCKSWRADSARVHAGQEAGDGEFVHGRAGVSREAGRTSR